MKIDERYSVIPVKTNFRTWFSGKGKDESRHIYHEEEKRGGGTNTSENTKKVKRKKKKSSEQTGQIMPSMRPYVMEESERQYTNLLDMTRENSFNPAKISGGNAGLFIAGNESNALEEKSYEHLLADMNLFFSRMFKRLSQTTANIVGTESGSLPMYRQLLNSLVCYMNSKSETRSMQATTLFKKSSMKARLDLMILSSLWIASRIWASGITFGLDSIVDMMKLCAIVADDSGFRICGASRHGVERCMG